MTISSHLDLPIGIHVCSDGEFDGWQVYNDGGFEFHAGPFWYRQEPDGNMRCAFRPERRHLNDSGNVHGGCLMTFADFCLVVVALPVLKGQSGTTINFTGNFIDAGHEGELIVGSGEITRGTGSLIFVRGQLTAGERTLFTLSGTIKRGQKKAP